MGQTHDGYDQKRGSWRGGSSFRGQRRSYGDADRNHCSIERRTYDSGRRQPNDRNKQRFDISKIKCYACNKYGHFASDCDAENSKGEEAHLVDDVEEPALLMMESDAIEDNTEEPVLLMTEECGMFLSCEGTQDPAQIEADCRRVAEKSQSLFKANWHYDTGASNHMTGNKEMLVDSDETINSIKRCSSKHNIDRCHHTLPSILTKRREAEGCAQMIHVMDRSMANGDLSSSVEVGDVNDGVCLHKVSFCNSEETLKMSGCADATGSIFSVRDGEDPMVSQNTSQKDFGTPIPLKTSPREHENNRKSVIDDTESEKKIADQFLSKLEMQTSDIVPAFPYIAPFSTTVPDCCRSVLSLIKDSAIQVAANMAVFDFFFHHAAQFSGVPLRMVEEEDRRRRRKEKKSRSSHSSRKRRGHRRKRRYNDSDESFDEDSKSEISDSSSGEEHTKSKNMRRKKFSGSGSTRSKGKRTKYETGSDDSDTNPKVKIEETVKDHELDEEELKSSLEIFESKEKVSTPEIRKEAEVAQMLHKVVGHISYGGVLRPGEGEVIAQYVQQGKRTPRRGEVDLNTEGKI